MKLRIAHRSADCGHHGGILAQIDPLAEEAMAEVTEGPRHQLRRRVWAVDQLRYGSACFGRGHGRERVERFSAFLHAERGVAHAGYQIRTRSRGPELPPELAQLRIPLAGISGHAGVHLVFAATRRDA